MDDAARNRLVSNIVGHLLSGVTEPVLQRAFWYLRNVDKTLGDRVEQGVRAGQPDRATNGAAKDPQGNVEVAAGAARRA
jgi:catalase